MIFKFLNNTEVVINNEKNNSKLFLHENERDFTEITNDFDYLKIMELLTTTNYFVIKYNSENSIKIIPKYRLNEILI